MRVPPILAALRKHKAGVALIALQIALTLAIVCNAVFLIGRRIERVDRPTGMNERNLFVVGQMYVGAPTGHKPADVAKLDAMERADLATVRHVPDVESAAFISSLPLLNSVASYGGASRKPHSGGVNGVAFFYGGDQVLQTLGLRLIAGRNFSADEITHRDLSGNHPPPVAIVSRALAHALYPHGEALGKTIYLNGSHSPTTIAGVVARLQSPVSNVDGGYAWNSILLPVRVDSAYTHIAVRARAGRMAAAMREVRTALLAANPARVMDNGPEGILGIYPFAEIRVRAYRTDTGVAILMGVICVILLCITAAGTFGLASFWVGQRRKQIGIRRALGATRRDILRYFQFENLMIAGAGVVLGALVAVALNLWLMQQFQMERIPLVYVWVGIVVLLGLGQGAVLVPALRASHVPPVVATRGV